MLRRLASLGVLLTVLLGGVRATGADDVPDAVQRLYAEALVLEAEGNLKKAYSALSKARKKQPLSVDFWELYVRVWRALGKKEDLLWRKILGPVEAKHPSSAVFAMLRARLAQDGEERIGYLRDAIEKEPEAVRPKLLLAKAVLADGDDIDAEVILEEVLERHPDHEEALVTKGELDLRMGRSLGALAYAEEQLEAHPLAGLHDLRARALLAASETDASHLDEAEAAARRAMGMQDDPRYIRTLVDVLDRKGQSDQALKLLEESYARVPAAVFAAKLGELAFREGDYEKAVRGLEADPDPTRQVLKGLAVAHGRLGQVEAMRRALARVEKHPEEDDPLWIARIELAYGDPALALKAIEGKANEYDDDVQRLQLRAHARLGNVEAAKDLADDTARDGGRRDEEYLVQLLHARLMARLGPKAKAAHKALKDGAIAAAKASVPSAKAVKEKHATHSNSPEFMERYVTYRRTAGGAWFHASFDEDDLEIDFQRRGSDRAVVRLGIQGCADCPVESMRWFWFNPQEVRVKDLQGRDMDEWARELFERLFGVSGEDRWKDGEAAFVTGCGLLVDESWNDARTAFERALYAEPKWGRAKLFAAIAILMGTGDTYMAADWAAKAVKLLPDDFDGQRLLVLIQVLAGQDPTATVKALATKEEARRTRRMEWL